MTKPTEEVPYSPSEMADLLEAHARSADRYTASYTETADLARWAATTIRQLIVFNSIKGANDGSP